MKTLSFKGGIHPTYNKDISVREPMRDAGLPDKVVIPLSQHIGAPCSPTINKGDIVEEGQVIGKSDSFISACIHSSVSGKVLDVEKTYHPSLGTALSVVIERDKEANPKKYSETSISELSTKELIEKVKDAGLVGMGGAAFPTHVKLSVPEGKKIETLIINGAECEPFLTCDHVVMTRNTHDVLKGIELMMDIIQPKDVYIAIEDNKKAAIFAFQKAIKKSTNATISKIKVAPLATKYPQGGEKQLIKAITGKEVPPEGLPLDIGFLVQNVGTVKAMYEAICMNKPLTERVVTISGDCLHRPGNYLIKIGTTIQDIVERCGIELYRAPKKVVIGGPMTGFSQADMDVPVIKGTSGILFLSEGYTKSREEETCIKCAKCVDVCPVSLSPTEIMKSVSINKLDKAKELYIVDCMECGACSYICPARIPLVQYIKEGKSAIRKK